MAEHEIATDYETQTNPFDVLAKLGLNITQITVIETEGLSAVALPDDADINRIMRVGNDLVLIQTDGSAVILRDAAEQSLLLLYGPYSLPLSRLTEIATPSDEVTDLQDIASIPAFFLSNPSFSLPASGYEEHVAPGDPLIGLPYSPLLPPTKYQFTDRTDREYGGFANGGVAGLDIEVDPLLMLNETDAPVTFSPSDYVMVTISDLDLPDLLDTAELTIVQLPLGTLVSDGTLIADGSGTLTFSFIGSWADYQALPITLPTDFSTTSRLDASTRTVC